MNSDKAKEFFLNLFEKIKNNKKVALILCIGLIGILLIALSSFEVPKKDSDTVQNMQSKTDVNDVSEEKLERFLSNISGVSNVNVMLTYDTSKEDVYAFDTEQNEIADNENKSERKYKSEHIIVKTGSEESGLKEKEIYPKVRGVAVICQGGDNPIIKEQIVSIVSALFDINSNQISVASKA